MLELSNACRLLRAEFIALLYGEWITAAQGAMAKDQIAAKHDSGAKVNRKVTVDRCTIQSMLMLDAICVRGDICKLGSRSQTADTCLGFVMSE